jgi:hypothetical protein
MSLEYYLVNNENKTFYYLGKGGWYEFKDNMCYLTDLEYLEEFLFDNIFNFYDGPEKNDREFSNALSKELFEFAKCKNLQNIILINDCNEDSIIIKHLQYKCAGSRYKEEVVSLDWLNNHIDNIKYMSYSFSNNLLNKFTILK